MDDLLQELWQKYPLYKIVLLCFRNNSLTNPQTKKHTHDSNDAIPHGSSQDGPDDPEGEGSDPDLYEEGPMEDDGPLYQMFEEEEDFLEATFVASLDYMFRKLNVTKYGTLDAI